MSTPENHLPGPALDRLVELIRRLRGPDGCPWDRKQTLPDLRTYLLEEAHEVAAAIDSGDRADLAGELGDLAFQLVFVAALAQEEGAFGLGDVLDAIHRKMVDRHPHVFGGETLDSADAVQRAWERRKVEREDRSVLEGIPSSLPALVAATRIGQKAAGVGFDWPDATGVRAKVEEELDEVAAARTPDEIDEEIGDLLFAVAQLARHRGADPEAALGRANTKFRDRFAELEAGLRADGLLVTEIGLEEMEDRWQRVKEQRLEARRRESARIGEPRGAAGEPPSSPGR